MVLRKVLAVSVVDRDASADDEDDLVGCLLLCWMRFDFFKAADGFSSVALVVA